MPNHWQIAKRRAKKEANFHGYCWMWSNPATGKAHWKEPFLFYPCSHGLRVPGVPADARLFGTGLYEPPEPTVDELFHAEVLKELSELRRLIGR